RQNTPYASATALEPGASATDARATARKGSRSPEPNTAARMSRRWSAAITAALPPPATSSASATSADVASSAGASTTAATASPAAAIQPIHASGERIASRTAGRALAKSAARANASVAVKSAPAARAPRPPTTSSESSSVPRTSAPARSARPRMRPTRPGARSGAGTSATASAPWLARSSIRPASASATAPTATAGTRTSARLRGRRRPRSARSGVRAPCAARYATAASASALGAETLPQGGHELRDGDARLRHGVAVADRHLPVVERLEVDGDAKRRADLVLAAVAAADRLGLVVRQHEVRPQRCRDLAGQRRELLVLGQREDGDLVGGEVAVEAQDHAHALLVRLLVVRGAEERVRRAIGAHRRLDDVRDELLVRRLVEVAQVLTRVLRMAAKVVVGAVVDALHLLPPEREAELDVRGRGGVVRALLR